MSYILSDKQQNIDIQSVKASSSDAIMSTNPAPPPTPRLTVAGVRRRDLKPSLMSHISGVHRLSDGVDGAGSGSESATPLPKYGVDCPDRTLLDEVNNAPHYNYRINSRCSWSVQNFTL